MLRTSARFTTEITTFETLEDVHHWLDSGLETRALIGDGIINLLTRSRQGEIIAKPMDASDDESEIQVLSDGDIEDLLDCGDIIGVSYDGETDDNYSKFGIRM